MNLIQPQQKFQLIPERIGRLNELAYNLWWSWQPYGYRLFSDADPALWEIVYHNPVKFLNEVRQTSLEAVAENADYLAFYDSMVKAFDEYMNPASTWFSDAHPGKKGPVAYFSAEFGLHESLPIYSGGLGVLAGDHVKGASDLGVPMVFIGFLYPQGYFKQVINADGWQEAIYNKLDFDDAPALPAVTPDGGEVIVEVQLPGRVIYAKVYQIQVGRSPLYMLDTDIHPNAPADRELSARLYGGDQDLRVAQEVVLGIGGVRALRALGINPEVYHMNEGHSAFLVLELVRELVKGGASFTDALKSASTKLAFTTHTPVAAGNDAFPLNLIDKYFSDYWPQLGVSREEFVDLAKEGQPWGQAYSMTALALKGSEHRNGVSKLHGRVSRNMWHWLWPDRPLDEVPIEAITNGVHTGTWLAPELYDFYSKHLGADWYSRLDDPATWQPLYSAPDGELWDIHCRLKQTLVDYARGRLAEWYKRTGVQAPSSAVLNPEALTFGFARRFATYKRATLLFTDANRLNAILNNSHGPVQIIFAGKSHPKDEPGKHFIQQVNWAARHSGFEGKIVFLEDYDMNLARYLVHGVDVWLNTPRRPYEASGTSGMKASLNGIPNCSILDGWWAEGYNEKNGWAIGEGQEYANPDEQDWHDVASLYSLLEGTIVPRFFQRDANGVPTDWIATMKEAIISCAPRFSMQRQVKEYTEHFYIPAMEGR
ncbi:MAG TPA: alpha-glucan family phosphorylase [Chloroflexia bacterium]|nr:alpha-glucan family phosphorylase [Chloroflexia bacterium]